MAEPVPPPTAGLPLRLADLWPWGDDDLAGALAHWLRVPSVQLECSGTSALMVALRSLKTLSPERSEVVELSDGLVDILHLAVGGQAAVLVNTLAGQANALDITVGHTFNTGNAGSNDKFAYMPLALARSLLDAEGRADRLTILLDNAAQTSPMQAHLLKKIRDAGFDVEIKDQRWDRIRVEFKGSGDDARIEVRISDDDNSVRVKID